MLRTVRALARTLTPSSAWSTVGHAPSGITEAERLVKRVTRACGGVAAIASLHQTVTTCVSCDFDLIGWLTVDSRILTLEEITPAARSSKGKSHNTQKTKIEKSQNSWVEQAKCQRTGYENTAAAQTSREDASICQVIYRSD